MKKEIKKEYQLQAIKELDYLLDSKVDLTVLTFLVENYASQVVLLKYIEEFLNTVQGVPLYEVVYDLAYQIAIPTILYSDLE